MYSEPQLRLISVESLTFLEGNPRESIYEESLDQLAESIAREGVVEPIIVRSSKDQQGKYQLIAGERRVRAAIKANLSEIPAIVRDINDQEAFRIRLVENVERKDLTLVEKVKGIKAYMTKFSISLDEMARQLGYKVPTIKSWFEQVDNLSPKIKEDYGFLRKLSPDNLRLLIKYNYATQEKLARIIIKHELTDWTARRFRDMFEANPEGDLDAFAKKAKEQTKTIALTVPIEDVSKVKKFAQKLKQREEKATKKLEKHLRPKISSPPKERQSSGSVKVDIPYQTPDVTSVRELEFGKILSNESLTETEIKKVTQRMEKDTVTPVRTLVQEVKGEIRPQILVLEVAPKLYQAVEAYARSTRDGVKEATISLLKEGLKAKNFWVEEIKP